jgi:hypothetical protein
MASCLLALIFLMAAQPAVRATTLEIASGREALAAAPEETRQARLYLPLVHGPLPPPPGSFQLIAAARERGEIDDETALVYRVFAVFDDPRLPAPYRGDDSALEADLLLAEVAWQYDTLSPATRAILDPFLLPPSAPGSWLQQQVGIASTTQEARIEWEIVATANGEARVWAQKRYPGDYQKAQAIAAAIDAPVWPSLTTLMGREPLSDVGWPNNGGDGRLDIYLVHIKAGGLAVPYERTCAPTPSYLLLNSRSPLGSDTSPGLLQITVHEIMHAIQFTYPVIFCTEVAWWMEATATWAQFHVYPNAKSTHSAALGFMKAPEKPLYTYDDGDEQHQYGAHLFPFYLAGRSSPAIIKIIWENMASHESLAAIDQALYGGLQWLWPGFTLANWNRDPVTLYRQWDPHLQVGAQPSRGVDAVALRGQPQVEYPLDQPVPGLASRYYHFVFSDPMLDWYNEEVRAVGFDPGEWDDGAISIQALVKIESQPWRQPQDWSHDYYKAFCRDMRAERIEELIIIVSNGEWEDRDHVFQPAKPPRLIATNIGCWRWQGTVSLDQHSWGTELGLFSHDMHYNIQSEVLFERVRLDEPLDDRYVVLELLEGIASWTHSGTTTYPGAHCTGTGGGSFALQTGSLHVHSFDSSRDYAGRGYTATHQETPYLCTGPGGSWTSSEPGVPAEWFNTYEDSSPYKSVNSDGAISGSRTINRAGLRETQQWHFQPLREP